MKKISLTLAFVLTLAGFVLAQDRSVNFEHGTLAEALAKAKAANKPVFFDGYTTWCGPCKYMSNKVFTQNKVADFFNANFICIKVDMESEAGKVLASKYGVKAFPTFLILDTAGNMQHKIVGGGEADSFIEKVKVGLNPETSLTGQEAAYEKGNRDPKFVRSYLTTLQNAYMQSESEVVAQSYLRSLKENDRVSKDNWPVYNDFVNDLFSKDFIFILTNRLKFTKEVGDSAVSDKIGSMFTSKTMSLLVNPRNTVYSKEESKKVRDFIETCSPKDSPKYIAILDMADAKASKNGSAAVAIAKKTIKEQSLSDQDCYNILSQIVPLALEYSTKNDLLLLSKTIDERIANLSDQRGKSYFENLKQQLSSKINGTTK